MSSILHFHKRLDRQPTMASVSGVAVRTLVVPDDVEDWLALRERAIAGLVPAPRRWLHADYAAEMFDKPWWHAERNWLALAGDLRVAGARAGAFPVPARRSSPAVGAETPAIGAMTPAIGAVTLAMRRGTAGEVPVVHWLLVDPAWRRRGIGRLLMSHLERAAWDAGWREVALETHDGWAAAVAFYQSIGYAPVRDPSPR